MSFYTDEQLSMIFSSWCSLDYWSNFEEWNDLTLNNDWLFLENICPLSLKYATIVGLLKRLEKEELV